MNKKEWDCHDKKGRTDFSKYLSKYKMINGINSLYLLVHTVAGIDQK